MADLYLTRRPGSYTTPGATIALADTQRGLSLRELRAHHKAPQCVPSAKCTYWTAPVGTSPGVGAPNGALNWW